MPVNISEVLHEQYGRCVKIENDLVFMLITLDYGPRILHFALSGGENMLHFDAADATSGSGEIFDKTFYKGAVWHLRGGHRLWVSPETAPDTCYPDNDPVEYREIKNGVSLLCKPQIHNNVQCSIDVTLDESCGKALLVHRITNVGSVSKVFAPWAITVMSQNGTEIVPMNTRDAGLLANRRISVWSYTNMADERVRFYDKYVVLRQDTGIARPFKLGFDNEAGFGCYVNHNTLFIKRYEHDITKTYPDGGCSYETYTNSHTLEMESLAEIKTVAPGETVTHIENWELKPIAKAPDFNNESEIDAFVKANV